MTNSAVCLKDGTLCLYMTTFIHEIRKTGKDWKLQCHLICYDNVLLLEQLLTNSTLHLCQIHMNCEFIWDLLILIFDSHTLEVLSVKSVKRFYDG